MVSNNFTPKLLKGKPLIILRRSKENGIKIWTIFDINQKHSGSCFDQKNVGKVPSKLVQCACTFFAQTNQYLDVRPGYQRLIFVQVSSAIAKGIMIKLRANSGVHA